MSEVTRLIVVRHGNTFNSGDVILRVGSATDIPLTETGMKQAYAAGAMIAELGFDPQVIFHAPLQRTCQSAVGIAASFPDAALEETEFLSELDYGSDDGKPEDEVVLRLGIVEDPAAITPDTALDDLRAAGKAALKRWDAEAVLPKAWYFLAERAGELEKQWQDFAALILEKYTGKTVVAVTSNGIARFSKAILPGGESLEGSLKLATGAFGVYEFSDGAWHSTRWNVRPQL
ncbi:MAG: histidine phosphatase family protein [Lentisphaerae bacterium]|nr:histidine phosphatase family protein [Lentisphaerota bacterium]